MKYIDRHYHAELHPETQEDVDYLWKYFKEAMPAEFVCISHPPDPYKAPVVSDTWRYGEK